jgi:DNA-binding response OmpR family regulator
MQVILLIHSDLVAMGELTFLLQHLGFNVVGAIGGQQALAEIYRRHPDVVIMAEGNCRPNGDGLCLHIRELSQAPIIILGQEHEKADESEILNIGADAYLTSPLNLRELLTSVCSLARRTNNFEESEKEGFAS